MNPEETLSIIKPDGIKKNVIGKIILMFEKNNLSIIGMKMIRLTQPKAKLFYYIHKNQQFYESLTKFMCSGPIIVQVLKGVDAINKNRIIMGNTNPALSDKNTIRKKYADNIESNIVHGSDSKENAIKEINFFFSSHEIFKR